MKLGTTHRSDPLRVSGCRSEARPSQRPRVPEAAYLARQRAGARLLGVEIDNPTVYVRIKLSFCQEHTDISMSSPDTPFTYLVSKEMGEISKQTNYNGNKMCHIFNKSKTHTV